MNMILSESYYQWSLILYKKINKHDKKGAFINYVEIVCFHFDSRCVLTSVSWST